MNTSSDLLTSYLSQGWKMVADGPTGVQLEGPKAMRTADKVIAILGAVLLVFAWPIGVILILCAMLDFWFMTKPPVKFLLREGDELLEVSGTTEDPRSAKPLAIALCVVFGIAVLGFALLIFIK